MIPLTISESCWCREFRFRAMRFRTRRQQMPNFIDIQPTLENYWRSIILFGRNVASYKFALGKSLLELSTRQQEIIPLQDLAVPFSQHLCEHLKTVDKQATSNSSKFLDVCRKLNTQEISEAELIDSTSKLGFNNVIDAFRVRIQTHPFYLALLHGVSLRLRILLHSSRTHNSERCRYRRRSTDGTPSTS
jgi:hypothetical protein